MKSVSGILYISSDAAVEAYLARRTEKPWAWDLQRTYTMTIEIIHLTAQIQRWLNMRVARHLAAQAERLAR